MATITHSADRGANRYKYDFVECRLADGWIVAEFVRMGLGELLHGIPA